MRVTRKLEELRSAAGLTQCELAQRSGLSRDTITKLETGARHNAHARTVGALAGALGVDPRQLMDQPPAPQPARLRQNPPLRRRRVVLEVNDHEAAAVVKKLRYAMDELLPDETPPEAFTTLECMVLVLQGWGYGRAWAKAEEDVRGAIRQGGEGG